MIETAEAHSSDRPRANAETMRSHGANHYPSRPMTELDTYKATSRTVPRNKRKQTRLTDQLLKSLLARREMSHQRLIRPRNHVSNLKRARR
jgi:hypothetical protein